MISGQPPHYTAAAPLLWRVREDTQGTAVKTFGLIGQENPLKQHDTKCLICF